MTATGKAPKQKQMDETLEDTFPASDPPSWSSPKAEHPEEQLNTKKKESKGRPDEVHQDFSKGDFMPEHSDTAKTTDR